MTRAGGGAAPSRVRALDLVLTAACNLRCSYCYQTDKRARSMEWATAQAALDLLLRSERDDLLVLFIGGEPLLEMPLIRQAIEYVRAVRPEGKNVEYAMSTNGLLLDGETVAFLAENRIHTQLSFDGVPAAQEWRGPGTHALLDGLLDRVREQFPQYLRRTFTVTITVHSGNLAYLADSVEYLMRKGVWNIGLNTLLTHDPGWTREHLAALDRQFARIFAASLAHRDETGRIPFQPLRRTREKSVHSPEGRLMCGAGTGETITVDVDGQVTGCVTFAESYQKPASDFLRSRLDPMRLGSVRDEAFPRRLALYPDAARAAEIFDEKQEKYSSYARCGECLYLEGCSVCPTSIGHIPGNTDPRRVPDSACAFNLVSQSYRERFPRQPNLAEKLSGAGPEPRLVRELRERMNWAKQIGGR